MIRDTSELLGNFLDRGHLTLAGRLVGAYRNLGQEKIANDLLKTMKSAGYDVRETDPFEEETAIALDASEKSPYVNRIRLLWYEMRKEVIAVLPKPSGLPTILMGILERCKNSILQMHTIPYPLKNTG
jgi:hypothetical protein